MLNELWGRKRLLLVGVAVATFAAVLSIYRVVGVPPTLQPRSLVYSGAYTEAYVDAPHSFIGDLSLNMGPLVNRATIYANLMASPEQVLLTGQIAKIPGDQIYAAGPLDPDQQRVVQEPTAIKRNIEITGESDPYRLEFQTDPWLPTIGVYAQAPTTSQAYALAAAAVTALTRYIAADQKREHVLAQDQVVIRRLGPPAGGVVDGGIKKKLAGLVFVLTYVLWCVLVLIGIRLRASWDIVGQRARSAVSRVEALRRFDLGGSAVDIAPDPDNADPPASREMVPW